MRVERMLNAPLMGGPATAPSLASSGRGVDAANLYPLDQPLEVRYQVIYGEHEGPGRCTRLGLHGAQLALGAPVDVGTMVALQMVLGDRERRPLQAIGSVTWCVEAEAGDGWAAGVRFEQLARSTREVLYDFIIALLVRSGGMPAAGTAGDEQAAGPAPAEERRLLVIDDDAITRRLLGMKLREISDVTVLTAGSGAEALRLAGTQPVDLAFIDMRLPDTDGLTLLNELRAASPDMAAVIITNYPSADVAIDALRHRVADFIKKPFNNLDVVRKVAVRTLESLRLRRERELLLERLVQANGELEATNQHLRRAQEELVRQRKLVSLGHLSSGLAHQINNPASFVLGNLSIMREHIVPALEALEGGGELARELLDYVTDALSGIRRVATIARDLRIFALDADASGRTPIPLSDAVHDGIRTLEARLAGVCRTDVCLDSTAMVAGVRSRLADSVLHLLSNAVEAFDRADPDRNVIRVDVLRRGEEVKLVVADNGRGIAPGILGEIFTPFFTTKAPNSARGLGLSYVHGVVSELGGSVTAESIPGKGTSLTVVLPSASGTAYSPQPTRDLESLGRGADRPRVLVVEDEEPMLRMYQRVFGQLYAVELARDGEEAIALFERGAEAFDAILCDLQMPNMGGIAFHEALLARDVEQASRVIFCTGGATRESDLEFCRSVGNPVIEKPVTPDRLRAAVGRMVARAA